MTTENPAGTGTETPPVDPAPPADNTNPPAETPPKDTPPTEKTPAETKPKETPPAEAQPKDTPPAAAEKPPAQYKAPNELTAPEKALLGDQERINVLQLSKDLKLNQEQAQKVYDLMEKTVDEYIGKGQEHLADLSLQKQNELKRDRELGGLNYGKTVELVQKAFNITDKKGEFMKLLEENNLKNDLTVIRFMKKLGESFGGENVYDGVTTTPKATDKPKHEPGSLEDWKSMAGAADEGSVFS